MAAVDGKGEFAFHTQLRPTASRGARSRSARRSACSRRRWGRAIEARIIGARHVDWRATRSSRRSSRRARVARRRRGASVHAHRRHGLQHRDRGRGEPGLEAGGGASKGQAPPALLDSYELERRPVARAQHGLCARGSPIRSAYYARHRALEDDTLAGEAARARAGEYLNTHARSEFNIPGFTLGARYDGSPIIVQRRNPAAARRRRTSTSRPHARAGARRTSGSRTARSLYDTFGFYWTLLRLGPKPGDAVRLRGARQRNAASISRSSIAPTRRLRSLRGGSRADPARPDRRVARRGRGGRAGDPRAGGGVRRARPSPLLFLLLVIGAQDGVDARLVAGALRLEPVQHVGVEADCGLLLGRGRSMSTITQSSLSMASSGSLPSGIG